MIALRQLAAPALALLIVLAALHMTDKVSAGVTAVQSGEIEP